MSNITHQNEASFKIWLKTALKANGTPYSLNTQAQYTASLTALATEFTAEIKPYATIFHVGDCSVLDTVVARVKSGTHYEAYNRARGNGSLSAGMDMYRRFLQACEKSSSLTIFTPAWFKEKETDYPGLDAEAADLLTTFNEQFSPNHLAVLSGTELLNSVFINSQNPENLHRVLEFAPRIKDVFGSIKGGNAHKYGLYYARNGYWMTGSVRNPQKLSEYEAIELGTKIRDQLIAGANVIAEYGKVESIEDYKELRRQLNVVTAGYVDRIWFLKYYQMLYPAIFATNYSDYAQRTILGAIGLEKETYPLVRMGQIKLYTDTCGISNVMFNKIFWDYYSEDIDDITSEDCHSGEIAPDSSPNIQYETGYSSLYQYNRIFFGAPGTGKSYTLNMEKNDLLANGGTYERVTFHPDYTYAHFVGTYKPVPCRDSAGQDAITYSYVPGPFMRTYVKALQSGMNEVVEPVLLLIEEINRANVAAVFGDVFQLLDRGDNEVSEYPIQATEDMKQYLASELGGNPKDYTKIRIPDNMFIWATMNSADQGVFPMDTAFKRRWDFTYLGIDDSESGIAGKTVTLGQGEYQRTVEWNALRKAINKELLNYRVNEDKLMGPYFISKKVLGTETELDVASFTRVFKNKVIMYLFDDAAKQKRMTLFGGCSETSKNQYSKICREFDTKGLYIFSDAISSQFVALASQDDAL